MKIYGGEGGIRTINKVRKAFIYGLSEYSA